MRIPFKIMIQNSFHSAIVLGAFLFSMNGLASYAGKQVPKTPHRLGVALGAFAVGSNVHQGRNNTGVRQITVPGLSGLLAIGVEYEYRWSGVLAFGGQLRHYTTSETFEDAVLTRQEHKYSLMTLAPFVRAYLRAKGVDFYANAGLGLANPSHTLNSVENELDMGFALDYALGFQIPINPQFRAGVETRSVMALGGDLNGTLAKDWVLKGQMRF